MTLPTTAESLEFADACCGCTDVQEHLRSLAAAFRDMEKARDHWKANCQNRVEAARLLIQRPDLPIERVAAYHELVELQVRADARWIDVAVELPGMDTQVLAYRPRAGDAPSWDLIIKILEFMRDGWGGAHNVTHWMPLPAAPALPPRETTAYQSQLFVPTEGKTTLAKNRMGAFRQALS